MDYEDTAVLLLSHGSSLSYSKKVFTDICRKFKDKTGFDAEVGYMKVENPSLPQAVNILKERNLNLKRIIATPVFLAPGIHTNIDIPIILGFKPKEIDPRFPDGNYPEGHYLNGLEEIDFDGEIDLIDAIGPNPKLIKIINNRILGALKKSKLDDDAKTGILLISHGSRLGYNKEFISDLFNQFEDQSHYPSSYGFMELVEPDIPSSVEKLVGENDIDRLVVVPVFIAPGIHTQIDIKTILGLIDCDESKNFSNCKDNSKEQLVVNKIICEEDSNHEHKYNVTIDFDGEVLYPEPIGADDILIDILVDMVFSSLDSK